MVMNTEWEGRTRAWRLLELIAIADPGDQAFAEAAELAASLSEHDELIVLAARQRLVPALADFLRRVNLLTTVHAGTRQLLRQSLEWNRLKASLLLTEARTIRDRFQREELSVAFNKGIVLQSSLYDLRGIRSFEDIDLMILPGQRQETAAALTSLGYTPETKYDEVNERLVSISRERKLLFQLYPDHLPHFMRIPAEPGVAYSAVDVAFSLSWYNCAWQVPMEQVLAHPGDVQVGSEADDTLPTLVPGYGFLFIVLHLFRESWFEDAILTGKLRLPQFADVYKFWQRYGPAHGGEIRELIDRYSLGPPCAWVCHHTDQLFGSDIVADLSLTEYCDPAWLTSTGAADGRYLSWDGNMRSRLRKGGVPDLTPAEAPPFGRRARTRVAQ